MRESKSICVAAGSNRRQIRRSQIAVFVQLSGLLAATDRFGAPVAPGEFFHAPRSVDEFLLASEKRMAGSADADFNVTPGGAGVIDRAARTDDIGLVIFGMNLRFHVKNECAI